MKFKAMYIGSFIFLPGVFLLLIANDTSSEEKILGKWKEVSWTYEKTDQAHAEFNWMEVINDEVKKEMYGHLIVHQAELWDFSGNGVLQLIGDKGQPVIVDWNMKGRGNVLELKYKNNEREQYFLQELTDDRLVLHFNKDLQVGE